MTSEAHPLAQPFRHSLRGLGASVTIIATQLGATRYGMVATAVMSLSMEPPSLAIAVNASASIHDPIVRRRAFSVNILAEWDERVARGFASAKGEARFAYGAWSSRPAAADDPVELPYLANGQASILCRVREAHRSGSHTLFVADVADVFASPHKAPLLYCDGSYGAFAPGPALFPISRSA